MLTKIRVSVTRWCEMNCIYCPRGPSVNMENYDGDEGYCLFADEILGILEVMIGMGLKEVHLTGGEPLRRKDLVTLVREITRLGAHVELNTNGLGVTKEKALALKEAGLDFLKISLDAPNRGAFLAFTGLDAFDKVVARIKEAITVMPVRLNCVVMRNNMGSLIPMIRMANELGVQKIHLLDLTYYPCAGGEKFWEREFVYLTREVMRSLEREFAGKFKLLPIYGCRFYEMRSAHGEGIVVLKEAQPTMRSEKHCDHCLNYCHEGVFTLRLSAGGYLNFCPCVNDFGVNALELWRSNRLTEVLERYSSVFEGSRPIDSFPKFLQTHGLNYGGNNE